MYTTKRPIEITDAPVGWTALPYHVALIPIDESKVTQLDEGADRKGAAFAFEFDELVAEDEGEVLERSLLATRLEDVLEANTFHKVTVLPRPTRDQFEALESRGLVSTYWVAAAREAGADLLLDVDSFTYPVKPRSRAELLSFGLFLLGPVELLMPDREYRFDGVNLEASLYDIEGLAAPRYQNRNHLFSTIAAAAGDSASVASDALAQAADFSFEPVQGGAIQGTLRQFIATPPDMKFRFGDRLGGGPGRVGFWSSLFIPSAWLQRGSDAFAERLTDDAAIGVAKDLAREIVEGDYAYIVGPARSPSGLLFDAREATLVSSEEHGGVLMLKARLRRPLRGAFDFPEVRVMGRTYAIEFDDALIEEATSMPDLVLAQAAKGVALGQLEPLDSRHEPYDRTLTVFLPSPSNVGVLPSAQERGGEPLSDLVPLDSVQLCLGEDLGSRGFREKSWTFDLNGVLPAPLLEELMTSRVAGSGSTIAVPPRGQ